MEIACNNTNGNLDIHIKGEFTFHDHGKFREVLEEIKAPELKDIAFDLGAITFIDSAGLGMLLLANDELSKLQKRLTLRNPTGQVKKMLTMARLDQVLNLE